MQKRWSKSIHASRIVKIIALLGTDYAESTEPVRKKWKKIRSIRGTYNELVEVSVSKNRHKGITFLRIKLKHKKPSRNGDVTYLLQL